MLATSLDKNYYSHIRAYHDPRAHPDYEGSEVSPCRDGYLEVLRLRGGGDGGDEVDPLLPTRTLGNRAQATVLLDSSSPEPDQELHHGAADKDDMLVSAQLLEQGHQSCSMSPCSPTFALPGPSATSSVPLYVPFLHSVEEPVAISDSDTLT
eukprot:9493488-Pyramimonas_sp.AAC.1